MQIITRPLADALAALRTHVELTGSSLAEATPALKSVFRTASIKSFEYTYELALKLILRAIENHPGLGAEAVDELSFSGLMRVAAERGFITSASDWHTYRHKRNKTSHTYNDVTAAEVFDVLPSFIREAERVLSKLESLTDAS